MSIFFIQKIIIHYNIVEIPYGLPLLFSTQLMTSTNVRLGRYSCRMTFHIREILSNRSSQYESVANLKLT